MKTKIAGLVVAIAAMAAMAPAYAGDDPIRQLAEYTDLSESQVKMILGCRSCYAGYRQSYHRSLAKFKAAIGPAAYEQLMAGHTVRLDNGIEVRALVAAHHAPRK